MDRLTWEDKDGGYFVDGSDCYELEFEGCVTVCSGEAIVKLTKYENMHEKLEERIADIERHGKDINMNMKQALYDLKWVLEQIS